MPIRPQRPCRDKGCRTIHRNANGYCDLHQHCAKAWSSKPKEQSGRGGRPWRRLRERILERDGWLCQCEDCQRLGRVLVAHEVDHRIQLAQGGTDDESNLRAINVDCHKAKTLREGGKRFDRRTPPDTRKGVVTRENTQIP